MPAASSTTERARTKTQVIALICFLAMASAQIALPLSGNAKAALTNFTVLAFAISAFSFARLTWELKPLIQVFSLIFVLSLAVEAIGTRTGLPFGEYSYTTGLRPAMLSVPVAVPLAWFAMGMAAWEVARQLAPRRLPLRLLLGGYGLAAWDLFLDPQMVANDYWRWTGGGIWRGIPLSNYLGWFVVGTLVMVLFWLVLERSNVNGEARPINRYLLGLYLWMAGIETLGFLLPFAFDDPLVGFVGGVAMVPLAVVALRRSFRMPRA